MVGDELRVDGFRYKVMGLSFYQNENGLIPINSKPILDGSLVEELRILGGRKTAIVRNFS